MKRIALCCLVVFFATSPCFSQNADELKKQLEEVALERDNLKFDNKGLQTDLEEREKQYDNLKSTYNNLKSIYDRLNLAHDSLKRVVKELDVEQLQKDLNKQKEKLEELKEQCETFKSEQKKQKSSLKKMVSTDSVKILIDSIKNLNKENRTLTNDRNNFEKEKNSLAEENKKVKGLEKQIEKLKKDSVTQAGTIIKTNTRIAELTKELDSLNRYKVEWLKDLAKQVDGDGWLLKNYSEVNIDELEKLYAQYLKFGMDDEEVAAAGEKIKPFVENCRFFAKGTEALYSPYDNTLIQSILPKLQSLRDTEQKKERKDELSNITLLLGNYELYVELFRELKTEIDEIVKQKGREHKLVYPLVKGIIKKYKEDGATADICKIPYLQKQLENYFDALEKDCIKEYNLELEKK